MMRARAVAALAAAVLAVAPSSARAIPPAAGGAFASGNIELIATIPDAGSVGARIIGDTMYVTTAQGLRIYDVTGAIPVIRGVLELPHSQNEDVDTNGEILLIAADHGLGVPNMLYVVNVRNPMLPVLTGVLPFPPDAHTITCINGCTYGWIGGGSRVHVVDLRSPSTPRIVGSFDPPGSTHDVNVDAAGIAWVVSGFGNGGVFGYHTTDPVNPVLFASVGDAGPEPFDNDFILHNSMRPFADQTTAARYADTAVDPGELLLVTEEDWLNVSNDLCSNDGEFQTGWVRTVDGKMTIERLDGFHLGQGTVSSVLQDPSQKPGLTTATCSAHYFDHRDGVAAVAWYEQGVRFLDVSDPRDIRQIGYFMPAAGEAFHALFHRDYVYVFDTARGIDVLQFRGEAKDPVALAPALKPHDAAVSKPSERWGYACRIAA